MKRYVTYTLLRFNGDKGVPLIIHIDINPFKEDKIDAIYKNHTLSDREINRSSITGSWQETRVLRLPDEKEIRAWLREVSKGALFTGFKTKLTDQYYVPIRANKQRQNVDEIIGFFRTLKETKAYQDGACRLFCKVILKQGAGKKFFVCAETNDDSDLWGIE